MLFSLSDSFLRFHFHSLSFAPHPLLRRTQAGPAHVWDLLLSPSPSGSRGVTGGGPSWARLFAALSGYSRRFAEAEAAESLVAESLAAGVAGAGAAGAMPPSDAAGLAAYLRLFSSALAAFPAREAEARLRSLAIRLGCSPLEPIAGLLARHALSESLRGALLGAVGACGGLGPEAAAEALLRMEAAGILPRPQQQQQQQQVVVLSSEKSV